MQIDSSIILTPGSPVKLRMTEDLNKDIQNSHHMRTITSTTPFPILNFALRPT